MKPQMQFNRADRKAEKPTKMEKAYNAIKKEQQRAEARKKQQAAS
jgi:hypothetical protein